SPRRFPSVRLRTAECRSMNAMIGLIAPLLIGVDLKSAEGAVERTANYQPPGSPGGANNWAGESQPLKTRSGTQPSSNGTTNPTAAENPRYAGAPLNPIPTPVPSNGTSYNGTSSMQPPPGGFPFNPTATPTSATSSSSFPPGSTLGTIPSNTSSNI